ncbi:hypothetical protein SLS62_002241 [Diatrype stigma]|uniref:Threonine aspartase n=1 Tax=Diatrype stigma TaxID=117547 RepID=A0AAN9UYV5_9PEZI
MNIFIWALVASMKCLREGRSAVEAVEQAIKTLEDKEITNAGFGSNLCIDGTVECDATIVDHLGRSGACGAVPNIRNPISLAKIIFEKSNEPLSLRRVPPNLLIGDGAKGFAIECRMPLVPNGWLVSKNSNDRFIRWQEDLKRAESQEPPQVSGIDTNQTIGDTVGSGISLLADIHRDHTNAILAGTWNEGQPDSPAQNTPCDSGPLTSTPSHQRSSSTASHNTPIASLSAPHLPADRDALSRLSSAFSPSKVASRNSGSPMAKRIRFTSDLNGNRLSRATESTDGCAAPLRHGNNPRSMQPPCSGRFSGEDGARGCRSLEFPDLNDDDLITDTVGAIAIDQDGRIAAGSSSGGIGMKHRGRIGPAALVGIGTAVVPANPDDPEGITVAAVTSGTGEHMATTIAAQKCADRLYNGTVRGAGGVDVEEQDESAVLQGFVVHDFQEHPGVKNSTSAGAIGVMAVKKTPKGYYLYFAHNTDSFALASMGSKDRDPGCVMSRVNDGSHSGIAQGARKIWIN